MVVFPVFTSISDITKCGSSNGNGVAQRNLPSRGRERRSPPASPIAMAAMSRIWPRGISGLIHFTNFGSGLNASFERTSAHAYNRSPNRRREDAGNTTTSFPVSGSSARRRIAVEVGRCGARGAVGIPVVRAASLVRHRIRYAPVEHLAHGIVGPGNPQVEAMPIVECPRLPKLA